MSLLPSCLLPFWKKKKTSSISQSPKFSQVDFLLLFAPFFPTNLGSCMPEALLKRCQAAWRPKESRSPQPTEDSRMQSFFPRSFLRDKIWTNQKNWPEKNGGVAKCLGRNSEEDGFFQFGKFCVLANRPEMLKEFGYFGGEFFCWEDVVFGKTTNVQCR